MTIDEVTEWWDRYGDQAKMNKINEIIQALNSMGGGGPMVWHDIIDVKPLDQTGKIYITLPIAAMTVKMKMWGQFYRSPANASFLRSHGHSGVSSHKHTLKVDGLGGDLAHSGSGFYETQDQIYSAGGHTHPDASAGSGLTTSNVPKDVHIWINGTDRTSALGGPWGDGSNEFPAGELDISAYMTTAAEHYLEIKLDPTTGTVGGRIQYEIQAS